MLQIVYVLLKWVTEDLTANGKKVKRFMSWHRDNSAIKEQGIPNRS